MLLRYTSPPMHGDEVTRLQTALSAIGLISGSVDGIFGKETARAVGQFQGCAGLAIDGIVGPQTMRAILAAAASAHDAKGPGAAAASPAAEERPLSYRMPLLRGADVAAVQRSLITSGHLSGTADGVFGPGTRRAVRDFQASQGLPRDGVVAGETRARLLVAPPPLPLAARAEPTFRPSFSIDLDMLSCPHRWFEGSCLWHLTPDGLAIDGCPPHGSGGDPKTVRGIWQRYQESIERWAEHYSVPVEMVIANIATESNGKADAARREPGYVSDRETPHRVSYGLMQTLISTAQAALGDKTVDRAFLLDPDGSIRAGTAYIAQQSKKTQFDPPVVACAYNAGSVIRNDSAHNRWRMRQFPVGTSAHADRWVSFFNDCQKVMAAQPPRAPSLFAMLGLPRP